MQFSHLAAEMYLIIWRLRQTSDLAAEQIPHLAAEQTSHFLA